MNYTNFGLEKNVEILSAHHVERFTYLRDNEQYQDADAIAQEYVCMNLISLPPQIDSLHITIDNYRFQLLHYKCILEQ